MRATLLVGDITASGFMPDGIGVRTDRINSERFNRTN
jgi:hypothetical protein